MNDYIYERRLLLYTRSLVRKSSYDTDIGIDIDNKTKDIHYFQF